MPVEWKTIPDQEFNQLPRRSAQSKDPVWNDIMAELAAGNTVSLNYADQKERGTLSRSVGRRAAHMGFRVDIRHGEGFVAVKKAAEDSEAGNSGKGRGGK